MHQQIKTGEDIKPVPEKVIDGHLYRLVTDPPKKKYICPECGQDHPDGDSIKNCSYVYGRRGWRKLGDYDG